MVERESVDNLVYLPEAEEDLFHIWRYVFEESKSLKAADGIVDSIDDMCQLYAKQPTLGELRHDLAALVRCFPVGKYVVFYVPRDAGIEVIQIVHGARDIPIHFRRPRKDAGRGE